MEKLSKINVTQVNTAMNYAMIENLTRSQGSAWKYFQKVMSLKLTVP